MDVELLVFYSSILCGIYYTFVRSLKKMPLVLSPTNIIREEHDFMITNSIGIELMTLVFTPASMGIIYPCVFQTWAGI